MQFLVVEGTVREGRNSIHAARHVTSLLQNAGHDATLFDPAERDIPPLQTRRHTDPGEPPADIEAFGQLVEESDGIILVSPEYNHSFPGLLKNLLDHLYPEYEGKPFSYVSVSRGGFGGVRLLEQLRLLTVTFNAHPGPALPVSRVNEVFDEDGALVDEEYRERFDEFVERVETHTERFA